MNQRFEEKFLQQVSRVTSNEFVRYILKHVYPQDPNVIVRHCSLQVIPFLHAVVVRVQTNTFSFSFFYPGERTGEEDNGYSVWTMSNEDVAHFNEWMTAKDGVIPKVELQ